MGSSLSAPGPQEMRLAAYMDGLETVGHQGRQTPLKNYCKGLLLPGERKSIEPMAARLDLVHTQPMRQSLHHLVAKAPWSDEALLDRVRQQVLPAARKHGLVVAWIVDELPVAYRRYLPKECAEDAGRREKAEVPEEIEFQTQPEIALEQIRQAVAAELERGTVLADAAYGIHTEFRDGLTELELTYVVGVQSSVTVWEPGQQPLPPKPREQTGRPPRLL